MKHKIIKGDKKIKSGEYTDRFNFGNVDGWRLGVTLFQILSELLSFSLGPKII